MILMSHLTMDKVNPNLRKRPKLLFKIKNRSSKPVISMRKNHQLNNNLKWRKFKNSTKKLSRKKKSKLIKNNKRKYRTKSITACGANQMLCKSTLRMWLPKPKAMKTLSQWRLQHQLLQRQCFPQKNKKSRRLKKCVCSRSSWQLMRKPTPL